MPDINILQVEYGFRYGKFACVDIRYSGDVDSFIYMKIIFFSEKVVLSLAH